MMYIGIDAGTSGSRLLASDTAGQLQGPYRAGPACLRAATPQGAATQLHTLFDAFYRQTGTTAADVAGVCLGAADGPAPGYRALLDELGLDCPVAVVSQWELVLHAETGGQPGLLVVCGSGGLAFGRSGSRVHTSGGWSTATGHEGGAVWMGREGLRHALRAADGRGEPTELLRLLERHLNASSTDALRERLAVPPDNAALAAFAPHVDAAARQGDRLAAAVVTRAALDLIRMAEATAKLLDLRTFFPIIVSGETLRSCPLFAERVRPGLLALGGKVRPVRHEPCLGAALLARCPREVVPASD